MKTKQVTVFGLFAVLLGLMPVTKVIAEELLPPQQVIQSVSEQLKDTAEGQSVYSGFCKGDAVC